MAAAAERRGGLDQSVWEACAGNSAKIAAVGALVYYFPQGHGEQAYAAPDFSSLSCERAEYLCKVKEIQLLASEETDEVYSVVGLDPWISRSAPSPDDFSLTEDTGAEKSRALSFAKILTPSDANNGGGFSVPRFCADSIFPQLDFSVEPPAQMLNVRDVHGKAWEFRHIYRGTPRRHLLTTGWSKFVNSKKLVAGDSVVFIKNKAGELFIGLRRTARSFGSSGSSHAPSHVGSPSAFFATRLGGNFGSQAGLSRNFRGKVSPEDVVEAVRLAELGHPFKIVYYPRVGSSNFVVEKGAVDAALQVPWSEGMRVKMSVETEDSSKTTWFQGTLSCLLRHPAPFIYSSWRSLEVTWDEPDVFYNVKRVSPWQVELVPGSPLLAASPYPVLKRPRAGQSQSQDSLPDGSEKNTLFPFPELPNAAMRSTEACVFIDNVSPAGMQGARHDQIHNFLPAGIYSSETSSPPSQDNFHSRFADLLDGPPGGAAPRASSGSFQLFGKTIRTGHLAAVEAPETGDDHRVDAVASYGFSLSKPAEAVPR